MIVWFVLLSAFAQAALPPAAQRAIDTKLSAKSGSARGGTRAWFDQIADRVKSENARIDGAEFQLREYAKSSPETRPNPEQIEWYPNVYADAAWKNDMLNSMRQFCCGINNYCKMARTVPEPAPEIPVTPPPPPPMNTPVIDPETGKRILNERQQLRQKLRLERQKKNAEKRKAEEQRQREEAK